MNYNAGERRRFPRAAFPCKIVIGSAIRLLTSHTENISEGGIRVMLEEKMSAFSTVGLEVYLEKDRPIKCKGRVAWVIEKVNPIENRPVMYDTGIEFADLNDCDREYLKNLVKRIVDQQGEAK